MKNENNNSDKNMLDEMFIDLRNLTTEQKKIYKIFCKKRYDELVKQGIKPTQEHFYGT